MKLYLNTFAPSPRRVRMYAAEKGIPLEIVAIDIAGGANLEPAFGAITSLDEVPALELADGAYLTGSLAICRWLEEQYPTPNLFGAAPVE